VKIDEALARGAERAAVGLRRELSQHDGEQAARAALPTLFAITDEFTRRICRLLRGRRRTPRMA